MFDAVDDFVLTGWIVLNSWFDGGVVLCFVLRTAGGGLVIRDVLSISRKAFKPGVAMLGLLIWLKYGQRAVQEDKISTYGVRSDPLLG
jgi:hypothetical protein